MTDPFWTRWQTVLVETTLPAEYDQLVKTDRLKNFERVAKGETGGFDGFYFNDSDTYKFVEACAYGLVARPSEEVRKQMQHCIDLVAAAQMPDGYINTYFQLNHPTMKWRNLNALHEMYCGGHLIEAGVAVYECLGDRKLMDVGIRFADHVMSLYGPDKKVGYCGHEEIELALIKLARASGENKYREFARWLVEIRGCRPSPFEPELQDEESLAIHPFSRKPKPDEKYEGDYYQDHLPIRQHTEVVGHAVRAMYLYIAAADLAEDPELVAALERTWDNLTRKRMYVTGGIGPSAHNEGFTTDYDLPNLSAYAETCAAIGLIFWGNALLQMSGNAEYAETMERALYNGAISGISLSGDQFFYVNPLESRGTHKRTPWFDCACCPPNIARLIGNVSSYVCAAADNDFYIHIPAGFDATTTLGGVKTKISVESNYPWSGKITVRIDPEKPTEFALHFRIPDWSEDVSTEVPNAEEEAGYEKGYAVFKRTWKPGDTLLVDLGMEPKWVESDPRVRDNLGRVALTCGPLIYTAESHDLGFAPQLFCADVEAPIVTQPSDVGEGIKALSVEGSMEVELFADSLYAEPGTTDIREATATFIPYYAWNNRGPSNMQVWVRQL